MKTFDILYARNSNGKINQWGIGVQDNGPKVIIWEGLLDGKPTRTERLCKAKNIGKMNETSAYEQGCKDAQSRWEKKRKQGYKSLEDLRIIYLSEAGLYNHIKTGYIERSIEGILKLALPLNRTDDNDLSKPMKAQPYFKDNGEIRIKFPCYGQPKLNGFRVIARWEEVEEGEGIFKTKVQKVVFRSKEGLRYDILEHIENEFDQDWFFVWTGKGDKAKKIEIAFDGEMYIKGEILSEISSAVRKRNVKTNKIKFHIFDVACEELIQSERIRIITNLREPLRARNVENIIIVGTERPDSNQEAQELTDQWIREGYEGGIFRDMKATYQFGKRAKTMVKLKRSQDKEFKIAGVIGGENAPELGIFICIAEDGRTFKVNPEGTHDTKREYLTNSNNYIGKMLTVKFFERTKDGLPFHAIGVAVRNYE